MRNLRILGLALALLIGVSCTAGETPLSTEVGGDTPPVAGGAPNTPPSDPGTETPSDSNPGAPPPDTSAVTPRDSSAGTPPDNSPWTSPDSTVTPADSGSAIKSDLLLCQMQEYAVTTAVIGPQGGQINVGMHSLRIPENALSADVTITAEQVEGPLGSVAHPASQPMAPHWV